MAQPLSKPNIATKTHDEEVKDAETHACGTHILALEEQQSEVKQMSDECLATKGGGATVTPGAHSVTNLTTNSASVAQTGVGGAPQGKIRRIRCTASSRPGASCKTDRGGSASPLITPGAHPVTNLMTHSAIDSKAGVGGAPQGKIRRVRQTTAASSSPGAFCEEEEGAARPVVAPGAYPVTTLTTNIASEAETGVGVAPQGKIRRIGCTKTTSPSPGACEVKGGGSASPLVAAPGARSEARRSASVAQPGVGGAPQGNIGRTRCTASSRPGTLCETERRGSTSPAVTPGGHPVTNLTTSNADVSEAGVGGSPQGKIRRIGRTTAPSSSPAAAVCEEGGGATGLVVAPGAYPVADLTTNSASVAETGVGTAPQGKIRRIGCITAPSSSTVASCSASKAGTTRSATVCCFSSVPVASIGEPGQTATTAHASRMVTNKCLSNKRGGVSASSVATPCSELHAASRSNLVVGSLVPQLGTKVARATEDSQKTQGPGLTCQTSRKENAKAVGSAQSLLNDLLARFDSETNSFICSTNDTADMIQTVQAALAAKTNNVAVDVAALPLPQRGETETSESMRLPIAAEVVLEQTDDVIEEEIKRRVEEGVRKSLAQLQAPVATEVTIPINTKEQLNLAELQGCNCCERTKKCSKKKSFSRMLKRGMSLQSLLKPSSKAHRKENLPAEPKLSVKPNKGSLIARPAAVNVEAKQRSIFEPGDLEKLRSTRNMALETKVSKANRRNSMF